ncbi:MAG: DNA topoisomerase 4 subunit A [Lachnospiraceae bacterium]|nr:DNA topoisomerase 4 subunit A [Lachnospiraceae bacterium]
MATRQSKKPIEEMIIKTEYSDIMRKSYIDYAMSVIISRALPDVRDGLKPVQRRTLYDMYELGIRYDRPYRKSARIVGDTMGKYHPHGDSSIYEALVVMSQDFKKGVALVDGHGNFGSIEGDGAAAMRYTEARLQKITQEGMLSDLDKDVVDFVPNFDETEKEPSVLPCKFPNLLVNGSDGIAVGMVTSMPPHNLSEVVNAVKAYMQNPSITTGELMKYMPGPDFPTGGIITNRSDLLQIYETGVGKIRIRGRMEVEEGKGGKKRLVITEIPYPMIGANISKFLMDVVALIDARKTTDIVDISNQSSKEGIRIVLDLKKDADVDNLKNLLLKKTKLEDTFGVNMLAVADGRPETLGLLDIIRHHVHFQREINTRKYRTLLNKEMDRKEIQEGLIKACDCIDLIIEILRGSDDMKMAKGCLTEGKTEGIRFKSRISKKMAEQLHFTDRQATAILEMRLYKLIGLEIEALLKEHDTTVKNIALYKDILMNPKSMDKVIIRELESYQKEYGHERKTALIDAEEIVFEENKVEEMDVVVMIDRFGYARSIDTATYERNKEAAEGENRFILTARNTGRICVFTNTGQMHAIRVSDIPFGKFRDKGTPIDNISNYNSSEESVVHIAPMNEVVMQKLMFVSKYAMMKQVYGTEFDVTKRTVASTMLSDGDEVIAICPVTDQRHVVLQTVNGMFLKFMIDEVPTKKKAAVGVRGMKLAPQDFLDQVYFLSEGDAATASYGSRIVELNRLKLAKRDTKGTRIRS